MTPEEWENLCDRCGGCCDIGESVACPKFDVDTKLCTIYKDRSEIVTCMNVTMKNALELHHYKVLPSSCAYVRWAQGKPPEPKEYKLIPFLSGSPDIQRRFWALQKEAREYLGIDDKKKKG